MVYFRLEVRRDEIWPPKKAAATSAFGKAVTLALSNLAQFVSSQYSYTIYIFAELMYELDNHKVLYYRRNGGIDI